MVNYEIKKSSQKIMIGKIICLARSYRAHATEMKENVTDKPLFFLKPSSSVIFNNQSIIIPKESRILNHEVELGIVIAKNCRNIPPDQTLDYVFGYLVALDITARDIQAEAKKHGWPWTMAKGFDTFCPISYLIQKDEAINPNNLALSLQINGKIRQSGNTKQLIYPVERIISYLSGVMTLEKGDLILTGTPEGVGPIKNGDVLEATLDGLCKLKVDVKGEM